eukprot:76611-Chlamydomonas_euryale.AAC.1
MQVCAPPLFPSPNIISLAHIRNPQINPPTMDACVSASPCLLTPPPPPHIHTFTQPHMQVCAALASKVSKERVGTELEGMIQGPDPVGAVMLLDRLGLFTTVFALPEPQASGACVRADAAGGGEHDQRSWRGGRCRAAEPPTFWASSPECLRSPSFKRGCVRVRTRGGGWMGDGA